MDQKGNALATLQTAQPNFLTTDQERSVLTTPIIALQIILMMEQERNASTAA